jgi:outer membrane scaffolding protein for murein synthesis (MipA/OmpV family)
MIAPAYDGSDKTRVVPYPYVDVRGLFDGRVYLSSVSGLGVYALEAGPVRGGFNVRYTGGRTSSDDPHLKGLPDIGGAAEVGAFLDYYHKPFALEARVMRRLGSTAGTEVTLGGSVSAAPMPHLHLSLSAEVSWADASYNRTYFGVTASDAAQATAQGNPLTPYTPGSGLTSVGVIAAGIYQVGKHWGLVGRIGLHDLVGTAPKDSPLTYRSVQPSLAVGPMYEF